MGGAHPTILPAEVLVEGAVDFVVVGDGERTIVELAAYLAEGEGDPAEMLGLGYVRGGMHINERQELRHPDELPLPARELFPLEFYQEGYNVFTATGSCPYRCPFCSAAAIWQGRRRARSPRGVVDELKIVAADHGVREVFFSDDLFTLDRRWVRELLDEFKTMESQMSPRIPRSRAFSLIWAGFSVPARLVFLGPRAISLTSTPCVTRS